MTQRLPHVVLACQGVLLSVPETMEDLRSMKKLWVHEILRVFYDRLVDANDRKWLLDRISSSCTHHLNEDFNQLMGELDQNGDGEVSQRRVCSGGCCIVTRHVFLSVTLIYICRDIETE